MDNLIYKGIDFTAHSNGQPERPEDWMSLLLNALESYWAEAARAQSRSSKLISWLRVLQLLIFWDGKLGETS